MMRLERGEPLAVGRVLLRAVELGELREIEMFASLTRGREFSEPTNPVIP